MIPTQINMQHFCLQNATSTYNKYNAFFGLTLQGNNLTTECPYLRKGYYALTQMDRGQPRPHVEALIITIHQSHCNRWGRFDVFDVRLYIGPRTDLRVLQGVIITVGN